MGTVFPLKAAESRFAGWQVNSGDWVVITYLTGAKDMSVMSLLLSFYLGLLLPNIQ